MSAVAFSVAGISFNAAPDGDGIVWSADIPDGWDGAPSAVQIIDKVGADGGIAVGARLSSRPVTINGTCTAPTQTAMWKARNQLEAAANSLAAAAGTLAVVEPTATKNLSVRYAGRLKIEPRSATHFRFQLPLVAANPAKT